MEQEPGDYARTVGGSGSTRQTDATVYLNFFVSGARLSIYVCELGLVIIRILLYSHYFGRRLT